MARLLVTGGAGFIGANFVHYWLAQHPDDRVVVLDALTYAGNLASLEPALGSPGYSFVRGDIRSQDLVEGLLRREQITTIVHLAAESHVDRSIDGPDAFVETNVVGTHALLKAARKVWLEEGGGGTEKRFHHVSTDEVYGSLQPSDTPFTERSPYAPNSPYAASKAASDHLVRAYHHTYGLPVSTSNCSNNYGAYQFPEKLIPLMLVHALDGKPLPIYGDGGNVRDWLYVEDHCAGIAQVLAKGRVGEKYNIGGGNERTNLQLVDALCGLLDALRPAASNPALAGKRSYSELKSFVTDRPGHDRRYAIDATRIRREIGWSPRHDLESGLAATVRWYLDNTDWCTAIQMERYQRQRLGLSASS